MYAHVQILRAKKVQAARKHDSKAQAMSMNACKYCKFGSYKVRLKYNNACHGIPEAHEQTAENSYFP